MLHVSPRFVALWALAWIGTLASSPQVRAQDADPDLRLLDRIVAVVDEDPILLSEVEERIGLGLAEPVPGETGRELRERVVGGLVDQRLRFHAVERSGFERVSVGEVESALRGIVGSFESRDAFDERLIELGMTESELRQLLARQIAILNYVDERLGARVFVSVEDIREHYRTELVPELRESGAEVPPLDEVREPIRALLSQRRLNDEIERWTEELRREADVLLFTEPPRDEAGGLPPVVETFDAPADPGG